MKTPNFRKIILDRLEELGQNRLWLVNELDGEPKKAQVYAYLCLAPKDRSSKGKVYRGLADMRSENIERIFGVLGLDVVCVSPPRGLKKKPPTPPKLPLD